MLFSEAPVYGDFGVCFVAGCSDSILQLPVLLKFIASFITEVFTAAYTTVVKDESVEKILLTHSRKGSSLHNLLN